MKETSDKTRQPGMFLVCGKVASEGSPVDRFVKLLEGHFVSDADPAEAGSVPIRGRQMQVDVPVLGDHVVYMQIDAGEELKVWRQRLLVLTWERETGTIRQRAWLLKQPEKFVDAFDRPEIFRSIGPDDVSRTLNESGCDQVWQETAEGWQGTVNPDTCCICTERRQAWRRIEAETTLLPDRLIQAERGFDETGKQVFGTEPGQFNELRRVS